MPMTKKEKNYEATLQAFRLGIGIHDRAVYQLPADEICYPDTDQNVVRRASWISLKIINAPFGQYKRSVELFP